MSVNSGTRVPALSTVTATLFPLKKQTAGRNSLKKSSDCFPTAWAVHEEWRKLLVTYGVSGVQVHDARLAAAMRVYSVKHILTFNDRDFARYRDIEAVHPRAVPTK
jgi:predicted nucleic acid-binding protein